MSEKQYINMNKYAIPIITFLLFFMVKNASAQPLPCDVDNPDMTPTCQEACIICDIDGFTGRHESNVSGFAPPGFCTFIVHNAQWIAFRAGSVNLSIQVAVSNCSGGGGFNALEVGMYEAINCDNYTPISNCNGGTTNMIEQGSSGTITTNVPLTIGQYYYLVMDGAGGSNCDWTLTVVDGTTAVAPLDESGDISGDVTVCPNSLQQYFVNAPVGAAEFEWTLNGAALPTTIEPMIEYEFTNDGTYVLCVTSKNACDEAPPTCQNITVASVPVTEIVDVFCENDCYEIAGETICETGFYEFLLQDVEGCDSLVTADLTKLVTPYLSIDIDICEGDVVTIGNTDYTQTGIYQETLTSFQECDSIVDLDLFVIVCNIQSSDSSTPAICFGTETGQISFNVTNGTAPFTYTYENLNATHSGNGNIASVGEMVSINDIPKGTYLITINDTFGNVDIIISEVTQPPLLTTEFSASDYNGFNVACNLYNNGTLTTTPTGGVPPYNYAWSNGSTDNNTISDLTAGTYTVTITDDVGCNSTAEYTLTQPEPLSIAATFTNAGCEGLNTGLINITNTSGGISPYSYLLDGAPIGSSTMIENLSAGNYDLDVIDDNGCIAETTGTLTAPEIPEIELGDDFSTILGESLTLDPMLNNISIQNIQWSATEMLSCQDCLNPGVLPLFSGSYLLEVTSEDGCSDIDSVFITVEKFRRFFAPNAFTPNFDGFNDTFTLYGGPEVAQIKSLVVFNRWGAVVFEGKDFSSGEISEGWNGELNGKVMNSGVYVWIAEIEFIDGVIESFSGDVTLVL